MWNLTDVKETIFEKNLQKDYGRFSQIERILKLMKSVCLYRINKFSAHIQDVI